ncbi:MAG TPA: hypothetical protein VLV76_07750 [Candidatus Acidoferrum sp.]|nr:hypothetical protein [Candidatus Acidoferrum sp.]
MTTTFDTPRVGVAVVTAEEEEVAATAVSWGAIFAGAIAAVAITLILLLLGSGIGLSVISPWYGAGVTATTLGLSAVIWLVVVQWLSSALGGFLAGRLRTKWTGLHTHEVGFRDTAHGLLAWSLATVAGAVLLGSITMAGVGAAAKGVTDVAAGAATGAAQAGVQSATGATADPLGYVVDSMFRSAGAPDTARTDYRSEAVRIVAHSIQDGKVALAPEDRTYLAQLVSARAGISQADAEKRVDTLVAQANEAQTKIRAAADEARKRTAQLSIMLALSMAIGAFVASAAAAYGGSVRDSS